MEPVKPLPEPTDQDKLNIIMTKFNQVGHQLGIVTYEIDVKKDEQGQLVTKMKNLSIDGTKLQKKIQAETASHLQVAPAPEGEKPNETI